MDNDERAFLGVGAALGAAAVGGDGRCNGVGWERRGEFGGGQSASVTAIVLIIRMLLISPAPLLRQEE